MRILDKENLLRPSSSVVILQQTLNKNFELPLGMDPEIALELVKNGATLLLLDVPQFTLVGIDTQVKKINFLYATNQQL